MSPAGDPPPAGDDPAAALAAGRPAGRRGAVRRLYDWVIHWAETPYGVPALALLAFAESSFFPIPPDVLLLALAMGAPRRAFRFAAVCSLSSVAGGFAGYAIGRFGFEAIGEPIVRFYRGEAVMAKVRSWYDRHGFLGVFAAALTPIPYKVFTIASGAFAFDLLAFAGASALGRGLRFFAEAALLWRFGPPIARFLDRYFNALSLAFVVLLVGGFLALRLLR